MIARCCQRVCPVPALIWQDPGRVQEEVKDAYNWSDGILRDLIECIGECGAVKASAQVLCACNNEAAQAVLERKLKHTFWPTGGMAVPKKIIKKIVMMASS